MLLFNIDFVCFFHRLSQDVNTEGGYLMRIKSVLFFCLSLFLISCGSSYLFKIDTYAQQATLIGKTHKHKGTDFCIVSDKTYFLARVPNSAGNTVEDETALYIVDNNGDDEDVILGEFYASRIAPSHDGNLIVAGNIPSPNNSENDLSFLAKYDPAGYPIWGKTLKLGDIQENMMRVAKYAEGIVSLAVGDDDSIYVVSQIKEGKNDGPPVYRFWDDFVVAKFDKNGELLWKKKEGSKNTHDQVTAITIDNGVLYVAGITEGNLYAEHGGNSCETSMSNARYAAEVAVPCKEIFIASFSTQDGSRLKQNRYTGEKIYNEVRSVAVGNGKIAVAGQTGPHAAVHYFSTETFEHLSTIFFDYTSLRYEEMKKDDEEEKTHYSEVRSIAFDGNNFHVAGVVSEDQGIYYGNEYLATRSRDMWDVSHVEQYQPRKMFVYKIDGNGGVVDSVFYKLWFTSPKSPKMIFHEGKRYILGDLFFWGESKSNFIVIKK